MRPDLGLSNRLFRHDLRIAINTARANFARWNDRLVAGAALCVALAVMHGWAANQPGGTAAWAACGVGIVAGVGASRLLAARIEFQAFDGLLAADAVQPSLRRHYSLAWHAIGIATLAVVTLIARPSLLFISAPAYIFGALMAGGVSRLSVQRMAAGRALGRTLRRWLHRPGAGVAAAAIFLLTVLPTQALEPNGQLAAIGIEAVLFALALTMVEQDIVRFRSSSGHRPWRIVLSYANGLLLFAGMAAPACLLVMGPAAASIVLAASAAILLLLAMRVLAYCVHSKRFADLLVSMLVGVMALTAYSMIVLLPVVIIALLWQLQRRAAAKTWMLA